MRLAGNGALKKENKKNRPFPSVKHLRHCLNKHMNRIIMFQSRLQGSLFVMRKYGDVLGADQTESGIWVREIDHIHYRKRKLVTMRLRCENVSNRLNISRTKKKMSWQRCENFVTTFGCSSGGTTCPMLQRQQWLVDFFDHEHYDNMLWQSLNSSTTFQQVVTTSHNTIERRCQTVIESAVKYDYI